MGQVLYSSATTTEAVRRAIQNSQASIRTLAKQYGLNPKKVAKWKKKCPRSRCSNGTKAKTVNGIEHRRRGADCGFPQTYLAAPG